MLNKILFLVLGLFLILNYIEPQSRKNQQMKKKNLLLENTIKEINILSKQKTIMKSKIDKNVLILKKINSSYFFDKNLTKSILMTKFQKILENIFKKNAINISYIKWNDSILKEEVDLSSFVINIRTKVTKEELKQLLEDIKNAQKYISISFLKLNVKAKDKKYISLDLFLTSYQKVDKNAKK